MTPQPPARIKAYFAKCAPICILIRRGPTRYSQMILWHTDTDVFEPGQWIKGKVQQLTMTSDGKYAAVGIMGKEQHITVCRPPYFTALEVWVHGLCMTAVGFFEDRLYINANRQSHEVHAYPCPLERVDNSRSREIRGETIPWDHDYVIDPTRGPSRGTDQQGREILLKDGRVYAVDGDEHELLFDGNQYSLTEVVAPDWARR